MHHNQKHVGFTSFHALCGVIPSTALVGLRFLRYVAVASASAQNLCGSFESINIECTISTSVRFSLSATPFYLGVFGTVRS